MTDLVRASEVRRAMMRAPWPPLALKVAMLVYDHMGLARGRCELGVGALARMLMDRPERERIAGLERDERAKAMQLRKRAIKRALQQLGDVLETEEQGDGRRSHRRLRTDRIVELWGDDAVTPSATEGGDDTVTPVEVVGGDDAVTPSNREGWRHGHPGGDDTVTGHQEDLLEDPKHARAPAAARVRVSAREARAELEVGLAAIVTEGWPRPCPTPTPEEAREVALEVLRVVKPDEDARELLVDALDAWCRKKREGKGIKGTEQATFLIRGFNGKPCLRTLANAERKRREERRKLTQHSPEVERVERSLPADEEIPPPEEAREYVARMGLGGGVVPIRPPAPDDASHLEDDDRQAVGGLA